MDFGSYDYEERKQKVEEILDNTDKVEGKREFPKEDEFTYTNGYKAWATAIFIDIRNSTELFSVDNEEEEIEASKVVRGFTSEIIEILRQNTENQLEEIGVRGDCVYAVYSTPIKEDMYDVWDRGVHINTYMKMYNKLLTSRGLPNIKAGIGMASAQTVAVKAGRKSSGINGIVWIGKAVSIASKLSDLANNGTYGPLLVSSNFHQNLKSPYIKNQSEKNFNDFFEQCYESKIGHFYQASVIKTDFNKWIDENFWLTLNILNHDLVRTLRKFIFDFV